MKQRCNNPKSKNYPNYGGRGIMVCERWLTSYQSFIDDMGQRPSDIHSIGRIDNDGNYEPTNCRWELPEQQNYNKRTSLDIKPGDTFGKLTILYETEGKKRSTSPNAIRRYFMVRCECGAEKPMRLTNLLDKNRKNQSCGKRSCNKYAPKD